MAGTVSKFKCLAIILSASGGLALTLFTTPLGAEYSNEAKLHYERGLYYIQQGNPDPAIREMEEAVRLEPEVLGGHRYLAMAYTLRVDIGEAVEEYETIFKLNPKLAEVPAVKVQWLKENEEILKKLETELKEFHVTQPQNPILHVLLSWLYGEEGKLREAYKELLHALEKAPSLDKEHLDYRDKSIIALTWELVTAMQNNSPAQAKTQLELLLFAFRDKESGMTVGSR